MKKIYVCGFLIVLIGWMACISKQKETIPQQVRMYYLDQIAGTDTLVQQLYAKIQNNGTSKELQVLFKSARIAYKKVEFLAEYYNPLTAKAINGAPIPSMDDNDQHKIDQPEGFQMIEPYLFPEYNQSQKQGLIEQVAILKANLVRLKSMASHQDLTNEQIFDALRLEVFRIITLGISGFDAPIAQNSMAEGASALNSIEKVLELYEPEFIGDKRTSLTQVQSSLRKAITYLTASKDFNSFDRMHFITTYGNPISTSILNASIALGNEKFKDLRALRADARTLFDENAFDANYYTASYDAHSSKEKSELGKELFYDAILSGAGNRSCGSCHRPEMAFTDGKMKSDALDGSQVRRNAPTLLNAGLQPALFYDNRVSYLEDQATEVINNKDEMHGSLPIAVQKLKKNKDYLLLFKKAFPNDIDPINDYHIRNALGSYIRTLSSLNSPFDKYVRGDKSQLNPEEVRGFNLYMGKGKCGTCHFTPLFNGTVPPDFKTTETEIIGVPSTFDAKKIDPDLGKYDLRKLDLYKNAFKTPTVRNIAMTAPYMHNGVFKTLEEVIDFYNEGGGVGLGMDIPNQTLPFDKLNLTQKEKKEIIAFLKKLTDNTSL